MKKAIAFLLVFSFAITLAKAQKDSSFQKVSSITGPFTDLSLDNLGNIYLITTDGQLLKFSEAGDSLAAFNDVKRYGKLNCVEASNPLKILLYYKNFSTVVFLDRFLVKRNSLDLRKFNIFSVSAITPSYDNNIWLYDEQENKLKKLNDDGKTEMETADFRQLFDSVPSPTQLIDHDGFVYLYDPQRGLYTFDYYGGYKNRMAFLHWNDITAFGKKIYGFDSNNFYSYEPGTLNLKAYPLPKGFVAYTSLKVGNSKLYVLRNGNIDIYALK